MKAYYDVDCSLETLRGKTLGIIGYGNQGRAQALNLRDSGLRVVVGSVRDESAEQAKADGFAVLSIDDAGQQADVLFLLIPDEVQRQVYEDVLARRLRPAQTLNFATGYNIHYRLIVPPKDVDLIMVAPRMMGTTVREAYVRGEGTPAFVAVAQDASGHALDTALAIAHGIGATRAGVFETTFALETELDLFEEQALWPMLDRTMLAAFEFLVSKGFPPEIVALELYGTGEAAQIFAEMARLGFYKQKKLHSQTSQYGTLSRARQIPYAEVMRGFMENALEHIRSGGFAEEWQHEREAGYPVFRELRAEAEAHPINRAEEAVGKLVKGALIK